MAKKIDPLNKKQYGAVSTMLIVSDVKAAVNFYQKALGFAKRGMMNGPDGKPIHAELTLRGVTLMLSPEMPQRGARSSFYHTPSLDSLQPFVAKTNLRVRADFNGS